MELLQIKPDMTTREIAEMVFGKIVEYKSTEYSSVHRSLLSLERQGYIQRVHVQLSWRKTDQKQKISSQFKNRAASKTEAV